MYAIRSYYVLMQGTPFIYQGQEIGMTNTGFDGIDDFNCVRTQRRIAQMREQGRNNFV